MQRSEWQQLLQPINHFLGCRTPDSWLEQASRPENLPTLLRDHLICELKAAQSAMYLIRRYAVDDSSADALLQWFKPFEDFTYRQQGDWQALAGLSLKKSMIPQASSQYAQDLIDKMVLLIKEELHHFYQVLEVMAANGISYEKTTSSRYAKGMLRHVRTYEPQAMVDKLICGAYIEARSCERFARLAPLLPTKIAEFYISLLRSEARHYQDYLTLAGQIAKSDISERIAFFGEVEAELISSPDTDFKFHSGCPKHAASDQSAA
ncbi:tRNA isopentenyl-2-thiomethyl-A-37 hydroxylase MiaE [Arsukibacterium sp. UBA3155]|uniref:tRNA isopentenyl-2-thiomethyl-A-37 hydroxylase MiaE n=1 Tax=Arsukibacterium sp. UBA3155 TaxID=1946058 RepID=UPI0025B7B494|nr:tRNA isopentenyl-2-thiomethyl-A-37 hydroxylase MiaE [Arsukibacterium sp. UBA3155]|tara:strand:+ start:149352 stop:150143 length:792 start_codon:yes stop_codon:yes gene_type:complete